VSAEELKALFGQPLMLLILMIFGAGGSALKQLIVARRQGNAIALSDYLMRVETVIALGAVLTSFLGLLFSDSLNIASALSFGYVSNDAADAGTKEGRSAAIGPNPPPKD
jgi:hypothetical protein